MCGICGIVFYDSERPAPQPLVKRMADTMGHRGPDAEGYFVKGQVGLGHKRLSIIDLNTGQQPIFNEDGTKCIVFNGEIYNFQELREQLLEDGHTFSTKTDTEVILHLYEEKGVDCVGDLRGMFTFAIWDDGEKSLFLTRDRLGIKPLYYCTTADGIYFASEMKSLLAAGCVERAVNIPSIDQYIALNYTIGPETIIKGVNKLMPGYSLYVKDGRAQESQYWDFNAIEKTGDSFNQCLEQMEALIEETTRIHLMSDVPLGAFLSGGVDSSVTVGVMARLTGKPVKTFTVGYEDNPEVSELEYARLVAKHFQTEHYEFILKPRKFFDIVSEVIWHLDEPIAEFATIPLLLLSKLAKEHVTVMLSGEGADEIFAGYPIYRIMRYIDLYQGLPAPLRKYLLGPAFSAVIGGKREGKYRDWLRDPLEKRYLGNGSYFTQRMRDNIYSKEFKDLLGGNNAVNVVNEYYGKVRGRDGITKMLYVDTKTWLPEDLLIKADKMTMAASLELRVPFLDHKMVEFAASLPSNMKATMTQSKYIFKKYAEKLLPREIVYRKKRGFPVPVKQWLREDLKDMARDVLLDSKTKARGFFNVGYIEEIFKKHLDVADDLSKNIWNLLVLEMWFRTFVDGESRWNR